MIKVKSIIVKSILVLTVFPILNFSQAYAANPRSTHADAHMGKASSIPKRFIDVKQLCMRGSGSKNQVLEQVKEFIDRFRDNNGAKATGIRVPIFFDGQNFGKGVRYDLVNDIINYADSKGMEIYANPAGVGKNIPRSYRNSNGSLNVGKYANRLNQFVRSNPKLDYLGPFNEGGHSISTMNAVLNRLNVPNRVKLVGSDNKLLFKTLSYLDASNNANTAGERLLKRFDIITSHNLFASNRGRGRSGTVNEFKKLKNWAHANNRKIWDSEAQETNKRRNDINNPNDAEKAKRITIAKNAGLDGIVIYEATADRKRYSSDNNQNN